MRLILFRRCRLEQDDSDDGGSEVIGAILKARGGAWRRMGRVISGTGPLSDVWGRLQSPTASRLSQACRSAQDDLYGTFKTIIGAIFVAVMQRAVVYAV